MHRKVLLGATLILALALVACGGGGDGEQATVRIGRASPLGGPVAIADAKGFFAEEGIRAEITEYPSGKRALEDGLLAGNVDLATTSEVPIVFSSFDGGDFAIVATIGHSDNEPRIIARTDSGISRPEDLRGQSVATQRASAVHFFLYLFLAQNGLSEEEVEISFLEAEELPLALQSGEIDAFSMREPFISQAEALLGPNTIVFGAPGLYRKTFNLVAASTYVEAQPAAVEATLRALVRAQDFAAEHPDESIRIIADRLEVEPAEIADIWPEIVLSVAMDQALLLSMEDEARWAIDNGLIAATKIPNFLDVMSCQGLEAVDPGAVTAIC